MNSASANAAITAWLLPLRALLDPADGLDWPRLSALAEALDETLDVYPVGADLLGGTERSRRLIAIRHELARRGHVDTASLPALFLVLAQFVCGYRDIDLRDATGLGHGLLIARHGSGVARRHWIPRLLAGELAGIAITEPHGGSRPAFTRTRAVVASENSWLVTGHKTWISRLTEAAVFAVFFQTPEGDLTAALVDAAEPGLRRRAITPAGLAGWTWGTLDLDAVPVRPQDILRGNGMAILRAHFAGYRPLVTATALGGAAAVFDAVAAGLAARQTTGELTRLRDSAFVDLGRAHAQLVAALLGAAAAASVAESGHEGAEPWSAAAKAHGVDVANSAVAYLAPLLGAAGFRADCRIAKTRHDLTGLLYADGIHDSLYRAAGKHHTTHAVRAEPPGASG